VPPIFTEPGWKMDTAAEIGIGDFQSTRSPDERYRTTPLGGLFTRMKGGFYHDGRFADLRAVVDHYQQHVQPEPQRAPEARAHRIPQITVITDPQPAIRSPAANCEPDREPRTRMDLRKHWRSDEADGTLSRGARS
jgi:hypothetical protein